MTLDEFQEIMASLPDSIAVSKYVADKTQFPRVIWNEVGIRPVYASNAVNEVQVTVAVEVISLIQNTAAVWEVAKLLTLHGLPYDAVCGYDEKNEWFTCEFNVTLRDVFEDA